MKLRNNKAYTLIDRIVVKNREFKSTNIKIHKSNTKSVSVPVKKKTAIKTKELTIKLTRINPGNVENINWIDLLREIERRDKEKAENCRNHLKTTIMTDHVKRVEELVLDGNMSENWRRFKRNYNIFAKAAKVDTENDEIKVATFLNAVGPRAVDLFDSFTMTDANRAIYAMVVAAFETYCNPRKNLIYERYMFNQRNQGDGETFDEFLLALKLLSRYCEYGNTESQMIRDRIVAGTSDNKLRKTLLGTADLTLDICMEKARTSEATQQQSKVMCKTATNTPVVDVVQTQHQYKQYHSSKQSNHSYSKNGNSSDGNSKQRSGGSTHTNGRSDSKQKGNCTFCGTTHKPRQCPAYGKTCHKCKRKNHFSTVCAARTVACLATNESDDSDSELNFYNIHGIEVVETTQINECNETHNVNTIDRSGPWIEKIEIKKKKIPFKIDSGADIDVLPLSMMKKISEKTEIRPSNIALKPFVGKCIETCGECFLTCSFSGKTSISRFAIVDKDVTPILGLHTARKLGILPEPSEENKEEKIRVDSIESKITKQFILNQFADLFKGLGCFEDEYTILLKENAKPVAYAPRRVPLAILDRVKTKLDQMEKDGIIEKTNEYCEWVSHLVTVEKRDEEKSLRLCLDPRDLNNSIIDEQTYIPTFEDFTSKLNGMQYFSVLDLKDGFWQVKLSEESRKLCTFGTPFGNYRFIRMPFGIKTGPKIFQRMNVHNFGDIINVLIYFDDLLIMGKSKSEHDIVLIKVLERAREKNVKFNKKKMQISTNIVKYLGHVFKLNEIVPDPERLLAVKNMSCPKNKKDLQTFLGVVNYMRSFIPNLSDSTAPLRELLKKNTIFLWTENHSHVVNEIKDAVLKSNILVPFDTRKEIKIQCDASQFGLGCCLLQDNKPISFASRSLTRAEQNYAQIEKEMLSIIFACQKFHFYAYGRTVTVVNDHKPLSGIMSKELHRIASAKLHRMRLKLMNYDILFQYAPGKTIQLADYLSRYMSQTDDSCEDKTITEAVLSINATDERKTELQTETEKDAQLKQIKSYCVNDWPKDKEKCPPEIRYFYGLKDEILLDDGLLFYNERLIVPKKMHKLILNQLHEPHFGLTKTKQRARFSVFWQNINNDIEQIVINCRVCQENSRKERKEPMISHEIPNKPFSKIACDILEHKTKNYLVVIDYYSNWIELIKIKSKDSTVIIGELMKIFSAYGLPNVIIADNVPFGSNECREFAKKNDFKIVTSSPRYPQSNGMAERAVGICKDMLKKTNSENELMGALLAYRSTPIKNMKYAPAQLLQNRMLRSNIPTHENKFNPKLCENVSQQHESKQLKSKVCYDAGARTKKPLNISDKVIFLNNNKWQHGIVSQLADTPRSYIIDSEGRQYRRTSNHIKKFHENENNNNNINNNNKQQNENGIKPKQTRSGKQY